jgi:membrane protein
MQDVSPRSPEERRQHPIGRALDELGPGSRVYEVAKRVVTGVFNDGFIHAGNLAYLTLLTLFPFFIVTAALASLFGRSADTLRAVRSFLVALPPSVQNLLAQPISDVLTQRTGSLLWLGAIVGLWTAGSFIETIRDILRRAYGTPFSNPFWHYRLSSMGIIILSVILVMLAFSAQVVLTAAEQFVLRLLPFADDAAAWINVGKLVPLFVIWFALYLLIWSLTPSRYRYGDYPKWPGALFIALWWYGALTLLPKAIAHFGTYDLTYGSLAGVIIALLFFWLVGLGIVIGAHLNAALAEPHTKRVEAGASSTKDDT